MENLTSNNFTVLYALALLFITNNSFAQEDMAMTYEPCCKKETNKLYTVNSGEKDHSGNYDLPNDIFSKYYLKTLMVSNEKLNIRKGPSSKYGILDTLTKYQKLVFLSMEGDWIKVRVKSTNTIGFVFYKYIVIID